MSAWPAHCSDCVALMACSASGGCALQLSYKPRRGLHYVQASPWHLLEAQRKPWLHLCSPTAGLCHLPQLLVHSIMAGTSILCLIFFWSVGAAAHCLCCTCCMHTRSMQQPWHYAACSMVGKVLLFTPMMKPLSSAAGMWPTAIVSSWPGEHTGPAPPG